MRARWIAVGWTCLALVAWLVLWDLASEPDADCDRRDAFVCVESEWVGLVVGVYVGGIWFLGLLVIGLLALLVRLSRSS
jgi:hypothetical protein